VPGAHEVFQCVAFPSGGAKGRGAGAWFRGRIAAIFASSESNSSSSATCGTQVLCMFREVKKKGFLKYEPHLS
jgi:hypothetical protein